MAAEKRNAIKNNDHPITISIASRNTGSVGRTSVATGSVVIVKNMFWTVDDTPFWIVDTPF